jgi:addiction module HigA family antidote
MKKTRRQNHSAWNIHPGEVLREEFLHPLAMSSYELAKRLRVPPPRVNDIVLEKRGITADTAVRLAKFFGTTEAFWMNLQAFYEVRLAKNRLMKEIERIQPHKSRSAA